MTRLVRGLVLAALTAAAALAAGFHVFVEFVRTMPPGPAASADGIVVLTGSEDRIITGMELLAAGRGRRLLISGVNTRHRSPEELLRRLGQASSSARCCVDLGYAATNTFGNAVEAAEWVRKWGFRRLIIVTSRHHMPRSLAEFSRAVPGVELIAHPVASRYVHLVGWWADRSSARILIGEYLKYLLASARIRAHEAMQALGPSIADGAVRSRASTI
jgi:uncharacterized SAM-binding protein YcdF (DUF218 family)